MGNTKGWTFVTLPKLHVAVLMGGWSSERPVSLMSGEGVAKALEERGHKVTRIDMGRDVALITPGAAIARRVECALAARERLVVGLDRARHRRRLSSRERSVETFTTLCVLEIASTPPSTARPWCADRTMRW